MTTKETNFQAESKKSGDEFENKVLTLLKSEKDIDTIERDYYVEGTGCEVDFFIRGKRQNRFIECKGGNAGGSKRPGAERTDNVKKAIASGALIKAVHPEAYYVIYFSAQPKNGNYSHQMIQTALEAGFVDEVRYV